MDDEASLMSSLDSEFEENNKKKKKNNSIDTISERDSESDQNSPGVKSKSARKKDPKTKQKDK